MVTENIQERQFNIVSMTTSCFVLTDTFSTAIRIKTYKNISFILFLIDESMTANRFPVLSNRAISEPLTNVIYYFLYLILVYKNLFF